MGAIGSGLFWERVVRVLVGPSVHIRNLQVSPDGRQLVAQTKRSWFGDNYHDEAIGPLENHEKDGLICDNVRIVPTNSDGQIVMKDGRVYDRDLGDFLSGRDTKITGWGEVKHTTMRRIALFAKNPEALTHFLIVVLISFAFDTGVFELGSYFGSKRTEKKFAQGEIPVDWLQQGNNPQPNQFDRGSIIASTALAGPVTALFNPPRADYIQPNAQQRNNPASSQQNQQTQAAPPPYPLGTAAPAA